MNIRWSISFVCLVGVVFLAGCARYKAQPLEKATLKKTRPAGERSVVFASQAFTKDDCKRYLGRNILAKGYQPVLVTITNNSKRYFRIMRANVSLPTVPACQVASRVHTSTVGRAVGYGLAGIVIWPFFVPAVVDSICSSQANYRLDHDFASKELTEHIVGPFSTLNGVIFVPKKMFDSNFTLKAIDAETEKTFVLKSGAHVEGVFHENG